MKNKTVEKLVILAMLLALTIVLSRFLSISAYNIKIGFSFIPIVICAYLYGPIYAAGLAGIADFLGAILFPIGTYFPGFTITAMLSAAVFGLFLKNKYTTTRLIIMVLINQLVNGLVINTMFISVLYGGDYYALMLTRIPQYLIMIPVQFIMVKVILKYFETRKGKNA